MNIEEPKSILLKNDSNSEIQLNVTINYERAILEINGPKGPEPTRYGDWEVNGRCSDF